MMGEANREQDKEGLVKYLVCLTGAYIYSERDEKPLKIGDQSPDLILGKSW
jgi:hypothetical protein